VLALIDLARDYRFFQDHWRQTGGDHDSESLDDEQIQRLLQRHDRRVPPVLHRQELSRNVLWKRSILPVVVGEYGAVSRCLMPFSLQIRSNGAGPGRVRNAR
jgi:hypothetical protein